VLIGAIFGYLLLSPFADKLLKKKAEENKTENQIEKIDNESKQEES
jgi:flagellar motor component MotA